MLTALLQITVGPCSGCLRAAHRKSFYSLTDFSRSLRIGRLTPCPVAGTIAIYANCFPFAGSSTWLAILRADLSSLNWGLSLLACLNSTQSFSMEVCDRGRFTRSLAEVKNSRSEVSAFDFKKTCPLCHSSHWHTASWRCIAFRDLNPTTLSNLTKFE